jgi:hypothetical protein
MWDTSAKLLSEIETSNYWGSGSGDFLAEPIGLLPNDPEVFYSYSSKIDKNKAIEYEKGMCEIRFTVLDGGGKETFSADILDKGKYDSYVCAMPKVEFDFSKMTRYGGELGYRIQESVQKLNGQWSNWKNVSIFNFSGAYFSSSDDLIDSFEKAVLSHDVKEIMEHLDPRYVYDQHNVFLSGNTEQFIDGLFCGEDAFKKFKCLKYKDIKYIEHHIDNRGMLYDPSISVIFNVKDAATSIEVELRIESRIDDDHNVDYGFVGPRG